MSRIRTIALWLLLLVVFSIVSPPDVSLAQAGEPPTLDAAELETFFDGLMTAQLEAAHIPGATLAVVAEAEVLLAKGYGYADWKRRTPVRGDQTLFRPGSVSKLFTWTAVMQLVEAGEIELDADVNTYLDFELPATYPKPITLYDLMAHTPGFEDQGTGLFLRDPAELPPLETYLKENVPARVYSPGEIAAYSNYGSAIAGYIVERVSGEPFEAYVAHHILEPLEMTRSAFRQPLPPDLAPDMSQGYAYNNGQFIAGDFEVVGAPPAGALSATAADMAKFMIAHLQDGRYGDARILEAATAQGMHQQHYAADPRISGMAHGFMEQEVNGQRLIYHGGDTFLFHSALYLLLEEDVGVFVAYNSAGSAGNTVREDLLHAFMDRYFPAPEAPAPAPPTDFAQRAAQYAGEYQMARANFSTPEKLIVLLQALNVSPMPEGELVVSMGEQSMAFVEVGEYLFQNILQPDDQIVFLTDDGGEVTGLVREGLAPLVFVKAPFYATSTFNILLLAICLLLSLSALTGWPITFIKRRGKLYGGSWLPRVARFVGAGFALLTLVFVIGFFVVFGDMDPAYGVPKIFFGPTATFTALFRLLPVVVILGIGVLVFAVLAWLGIGHGREGYWPLGARLHYTALALSVVVMVWLLSFWRIWGGL